jgi:hypothetical protein
MENSLVVSDPDIQVENRPLLAPSVSREVAVAVLEQANEALIHDTHPA